MTKNYIFRKFECGLSKEETAKLCFKSVRTVTGWDGGKSIPPECKRLMRLAKCRELHFSEEWRDFRIVKGKLALPNGDIVTAQEVITGIALIHIRAPDDMRTCSKLLRYARLINRVKNK